MCFINLLRSYLNIVYSPVMNANILPRSLGSKMFNLDKIKKNNIPCQHQLVAHSTAMMDPTNHKRMIIPGKYEI